MSLVEGVWALAGSPSGAFRCFIYREAVCLRAAAALGCRQQAGDTAWSVQRHAGGGRLLSRPALYGIDVDAEQSGAERTILPHAARGGYAIANVTVHLQSNPSISVQSLYGRQHPPRNAPRLQVLPERERESYPHQARKA